MTLRAAGVRSQQENHSTPQKEHTHTQLDLEEVTHQAGDGLDMHRGRE